MGQSVDDLLNAIKQEYGENNQAPSSNAQGAKEKASNSPSSTADPTHPLFEKAESIDDLLEDLGVDSPTSSPPPTPFSTVRESSPSSSSTPTSSFSVPSHQAAATDSVLAQVKQQYAAEEAERERQRQEALEADRLLQQQLEEQARQQQLAEERRQRELEAQRQREWEAEQERLRQLEEQRKAERLKKAQDWLKELDPNSDEGFWFESFAVNYPSKIDAALEYLSAMEQAEG